MNIDINNDKSTIRQTSEHGAETIKEVLTEDLISAFSQAESSFESPVLPGPYGVRRFVRKGNSTYYLYLEAPRAVTLNYNMDAYEDNYHDLYDDMDDVYSLLESFDIPIEEEEYGTFVAKVSTVAPHTAWMVKLVETPNGVSYNGMEVYALKSPAITGQEKLYQYPFSNIYREARVCWGDVMLYSPSAQSIQGLSTRFLGSLFNLDLFSNVKYVETDYGSYNDTLILHSQISTMDISNESKLEELHAYFLNAWDRNHDHVYLDEKFDDFIERN